MFSHSDTLEFIAKAQNGDEGAKEALISENMPLIKSIIKHYKNRQVEYEDLIQLGSLGLMKAILNFNTTFGVKFSTYAVPMIAGEVKRFIRDDGAIKVSRAIKSLSAKINIYVEAYKNQFSKDPTIEEIAKEFSIERQEAVYVMDSNKFTVSLFEKYDEDGGKDLMDKIPSGEEQNDVIDKILLKDIIKSLPEKEKLIIVLRYYRDKTQSEIATVLGVSQVQVSRIETKILEKMKKAMQ